MLPEDKYFRTLTEDKLWQRYCGFLTLSIDEFMDIQRGLLMDEIALVANSLLGKKIMGNQRPISVEEFRRTTPLTVYDDYEPYLSEQRDDAVAKKPDFWARSAGRKGCAKWIPFNLTYYEKFFRNGLGSFILASARQEGQVNIAPGFHLLAVLPPPPYPSGIWLRFMQERFSYQAIPPLEEVGKKDFQETMMKGLQIALKDGVDIAVALGSILVRIGESFSGKTRGIKFSSYMLHPKIIFRLLRAKLLSKREKRAVLPKDLWPLKGIVTGGVDTDIYANEIFHYWGVKPYEFFVSVETGIIAMQGWKKKAMTFIPDMAFLEFIPEEESLKSIEDNNYQPSTVLLDEVEEGKLYELVVTQFYGMPLLRYRMKDLFKVVALRDDETKVHLPQFVFQRRLGDTIDLTGLARLDEKTIWKALANTGIKYTEWSACKEYDQNQSFLRIYLELREEKGATKIESMIDKELKVDDSDYKDIDHYLKVQPVRVSLLPPGTFQRYMNEKRKEGADPAHLKPPHVNPSEADINLLLQLSGLSNK